MKNKNEFNLLIENTNLSEDDFLNKFLDFVEKAGYYYVLPDWMALKLNRLGDSGISRGELESRQRRHSNIISIKPKQDAIVIMNIGNMKSFWGSYNSSVRIENLVENGSSYNIYARTSPIPNLTIIPIIFIFSFILSVTLIRDTLATIILSFFIPIAFMKLSPIKMSGTIEIPAKKIEEIISDFRNSIVTNKASAQL